MLRRSLGARILILVAGGSIFLASLLAVVAHRSFRAYYTEVVALRAGKFAEGILARETEFWEDYSRVPGFFSERMQSLVTFEPDTGLYIVSMDGRILATSGEGKLFWGNDFQVNLVSLRMAAEVSASNNSAVIIGTDPDHPNHNCVIAVRPILYNGKPQAWLYVVARSAGGLAEPQLVRSYAIQGAVQIALITMALGLLVTIATLALVARPLAALTRTAEQQYRLADRLDADQPLQIRSLPFIERQDEIGTMARSFNALLIKLRQMTQDIKSTDERRRSRIANVSHDLRTPLTALTAQLETLLIKRETLATSDQQQYLQSALQNAQHLRRLTDSLADLSKFDSPDMKANVEPVDIGDLIEAMAQRYAARAEQENKVIRAEYDAQIPWVSADLALIERLLANLIDNALRVLGENGAVVLGATIVEKGVKLFVKDNGPGISETDRLQVFEPFFQTSTHRQYRGSAGLGLTIVKRIAELHSTEIELESTLGYGAIFSLTLPRS